MCSKVAIFAVLLSTRELFYDQLHSETYYDVFCQPQVDATYVNVVTIHSSDPSVKYLVLSLESDRSNIHQTREVLFYINYFSSSSNQNVDHYFVAKLQVSGSDREQLPKMRIALPLGDADLYKKVQVLSHSRLACGGLSSSIEIHSNGIADTVTFEPKEAKLNDNKTCKYLQKYLPLVPEKSQRHEPPIKQIPPVKPLVIREKGQKQKPSDQSLTARLDEETPSMTVIVDKSLFIAYAFIVLAASLLLIAFAVLVKTGRVERRNWEKMRQCFCWTGNRRPSNAEIQQLPLRQVQEPRLNGDANGNQQVPLYAIRPDDRGPPPGQIKRCRCLLSVRNEVVYLLCKSL